MVYMSFSSPLAATIMLSWHIMYRGPRKADCGAVARRKDWLRFLAISSWICSFVRHDYTNPFSTAASAFKIEEPAAPMTAVRLISTCHSITHDGAINSLL